MSQPSEPEPQLPDSPAELPPSTEPPRLQMPYEFSPPHLDIIRALSGKMRVVGVFYVLASCLVGMAGLTFLFFSPFIGVLYFILLIPQLLIGIWTIHAAHSFRLIVNTKGRDIPNLMTALTDLRKLYSLMFWLLITALVFVLLAVGIGVFFWTTGIIPGTRESSTFTGLVIGSVKNFSL